MHNDLFKSLLSTLLGTYPEEKLLGHRVILSVFFLRSCCAVFHGSYTILHSHQQGIRVSDSSLLTQARLLNPSPGNTGSPVGSKMLAEIVQQLLCEECLGWGSDASHLGRHQGSLSCQHPHPWMPSPGFSPLALTFPDPALPGRLRPGQRA